MSQKRLSVFLAVVAIFSALTAALTSVSAVPSPTRGFTHVGDTIIYLASLLFGSSAGLAVGLIGPTLADIVVGYPRWYVTLVAHGLQGYIAGMGKGKGLKVQVIAMIAAGLVMSFTYFVVNVFVKGRAPALVSLFRDTFGQTLISVLLAALLVKPLEKNPIIRKASQMMP
ncbi:ECF transporter S component [Infirmifilum lucidum]|uniref:ECF transporter S component n=1 Tax=Infirmifilum lucidum TaxID=2776706 RepID=A0A7L9FI05_9CREN|nr:ECF transporter S component [Infirmifilum lucidum]QOJ78544.1 ECF transporter S component [Infirmifilum lucidum]